MTDPDGHPIDRDAVERDDALIERLARGEVADDPLAARAAAWRDEVNRPTEES